jgi:hypothetical protein
MTEQDSDCIHSHGELDLPGQDKGAHRGAGKAPPTHLVTPGLSFH